MKNEMRMEKIVKAIINSLDQDIENPEIHYSIKAPRNFKTGHVYRGVNHIVLSIVGRQYSEPYYMTFKQAYDMGATKVNKGGIPITYYELKDYEKNGEIKKIPFLKISYVFNIDLVEGLEAKLPKTPESINSMEAYEFCKGYFEAEQIKFIKTNSINPAYIPEDDTIMLPDMKKKNRAFMSLFHEMIHSTGKKQRLNRTLTADRSSKAYHYEELIAQIGASFLCDYLGYYDEEAERYSKIYVSGYSQSLPDRVKQIVDASKEAEKAASYIMKSFHLEGGKK